MPKLNNSTTDERIAIRHGGQAAMMMNRITTACIKKQNQPLNKSYQFCGKLGLHKNAVFRNFFVISFCSLAIFLKKSQR